MERYTLEDYEAYRKEQDEKAAKEAEELQEKMEKESARRAWLADGDKVADFERELPHLRDEGRRQRVVGADRRRATRIASEDLRGAAEGYSMGVWERTSRRPVGSASPWRRLPRSWASPSRPCGGASSARR